MFVLCRISEVLLRRIQLAWCRHLGLTLLDASAILWPMVKVKDGQPTCVFVIRQYFYLSCQCICRYLISGICYNRMMIDILERNE